MFSFHCGKLSFGALLRELSRFRPRGSFTPGRGTTPCVLEGVALLIAALELRVGASAPPRLIDTIAITIGDVLDHCSFSDTSWVVGGLLNHYSPLTPLGLRASSSGCLAVGTERVITYIGVSL